MIGSEAYKKNVKAKMSQWIAGRDGNRTEQRVTNYLVNIKKYMMEGEYCVLLMEYLFIAQSKGRKERWFRTIIKNKKEINRTSMDMINR
jgi:hypothetical protein